jgi:tRNA threonylcarbamoyladenosine biosynthesis protein TsaE
MTKLIYQTTSSSQTKKLAGLLASTIVNQKRTRSKNALIIALAGDLGAGKTTFVQGFLRGLGIKKKITSPTFVLIKKFVISVNPRINLFKPAAVYHIDCYRIKKLAELLQLGIKEIFNNPKNIVLIEWPEKIKRILPKNIIWIKFKYGEKSNYRTIKFCDKI